MKLSRALRHSGIEPLEPRIAPAANLVLQNVVTTLPGISVPGDSGKVTFELANTGDEKGDGTSGIHIFLSSDSVLGGGDLLIGRYPDRNVAVPEGKTFKFSAPVDLPALSLPSPQFPEGNMHVIVQFVGLGKVQASAPVQYVFQFGKVGDRNGVALPFEDGDGTTGEFQLNSAGGTGDLTVTGGFVDLAIVGTDSKARAGIAKAKGGNDGRIALRDVTASALGLLNLTAANITGNVNLPFGVGDLGLGDFGTAGGAPKSITIGAELPDKPTKILLGRVNEADITSQAGIAVLKVVDWHDANAEQDLIQAPFISKLEATGSKKQGIAGDFEASLKLSNADGKGYSLELASVAGILAKGSWVIDPSGGSVRKITAGSISQWTFASDFDLDTLETKGDLTGNTGSVAIRASFFDDIKVGGTLASFIKATGSATDGYSVEKLIAGRVAGGTFEGVAGGISKVSVGEWLGGGALKAEFIKTLESTGKVGDGDFTAALTLMPGAPQKAGTLTKATIAGALRAASGSVNWTIDGDIGSLTAGEIDVSWFLLGTTGTGATATYLDTLKVEGEVAGSVVTAKIGNVEIRGEFRGSIIATGGSLAKLTLGKVTAGTISASKIIRKLSATQWVGGAVTAGYLGDFTIRGSSKENLPGNLANAVINITEPGNLIGDSFLFTSIRAAGGMAGVTINSNSEIFLIEAEDWIGGNLTASGLRELEFFGGKKGGSAGDLQSVAISLGSIGAESMRVAGRVDQTTVATTGSIREIIVGGMSQSTINAGEIGSFEVSAKSTLALPLYAASKVTATGRIGTVAVREVGEGPSAFGFEASKITRYSRSTNGVVTTLEKLDAPGTFDVLNNYRVTLT